MNGKGIEAWTAIVETSAQDSAGGEYLRWTLVMKPNRGLL